MSKKTKPKPAKPARSPEPLVVKTVYGVPQYSANPSKQLTKKISPRELGLSSAGHRVFQLLYLLMLENPKKDKLYFHFSTVPKPSLISLTTFKEGMNDLLAKEVIFRSTQDFTFFVNVNYLIEK